MLGSPAAVTLPLLFPSSRFQASPSAPPPPWPNVQGGTHLGWAGVEANGRTGRWEAGAGRSCGGGLMGVEGGARVKVDWER